MIHDDGILDTHVCYRCGSVNGEFVFDELSAVHHCGECGAEGVITFRQSIDILNQLVLSGTIKDITDHTELGYEINES